MFLIDFDSKQAIVNSFNDIAEQLFNHYVIHVNSNFYRFLEVEFYYYNEECDHADVFSHKHSHQLRTGFWYAHGSGIDITLGDGKVYGGILIRGIEKLKPNAHNSKQSDNVTMGPHKVLTELIGGLNNILTKQTNVFKLSKVEEIEIPLKQVPRDEIIQTKRIGLSRLKDVAGNYYNAEYRYLIFPHLAHKNKQEIANQLMKKWGNDHSALDRIKTLMGSEFLKEHR